MRSVAGDIILGLAMSILAFWLLPMFILTILIYVIGGTITGLGIFSVCYMFAEKINDYLDTKFNSNMW